MTRQYAICVSLNLKFTIIYEFISIKCSIYCVACTPWLYQITWTNLITFTYYHFLTWFYASQTKILTLFEIYTWCIINDPMWLSITKFISLSRKISWDLVMIITCMNIKRAFFFINNTKSIWCNKTKFFANRIIDTILSTSLKCLFRKISYLVSTIHIFNT